MVSHNKNLSSFHQLVSSKYQINKQKPISKQNGGTKKRNMATFKRVTSMLSGGEDIQMICNYLKEEADPITVNLQVVLNMIQKYNSFGKTQTENNMKQHLLHCISSTLSLSKARALGLKVGNTTYIQNQKSNFQIKERKKNIKRELHNAERRKK